LRKVLHGRESISVPAWMAGSSPAMTKRK